MMPTALLRTGPIMSSRLISVNLDSIMCFHPGLITPNVSMLPSYVVGDIDSTGRSKGGTDEIWDALRINEPGAPKIGSNNLEICIDNGMNTNIFSNPIDVVYIPMSRMLWKDLL